MRVSGHQLARFIVDVLEANGVKLREESMVFSSRYVIENALRWYVQNTKGKTVTLKEGNFNPTVKLPSGYKGTQGYKGAQEC